MKLTKTQTRHRHLVPGRSPGLLRRVPGRYRADEDVRGKDLVDEGF